MRIIPIITAIIVMGFLYLLVIERDSLLAFASGSGNAEEMAEMKEDDPAAAPDKTLKVNTINVVAVHSTAKVIDSAVIVRGQTEAARQVDARAETSGQVVSQPLRKGNFVEEGEAMCTLDPGTRAASLAEAQGRLGEAKARVPEMEARLEEAKARLDEAKINNNAAAKLSEGGYASETRVASAQAAVRAAEAGVQSALSGRESTAAGIQSAEAGVAVAQKEIDRLVIHAPFAGLLESDTAELGSFIQPGGLCATIIQLDPIKLVGFVPETEVGRVQIGALAGARLSDGEEARGRVSFLSRSADPQTRTFRVEIQVPNAGLKIRDGQTAEILIAADGETAHLLPQSVLTLNDDGALGVRVVSEDNMAKFLPVRLLRDTIEGVWVSGLGEAVDVIVIGQDYVIDGVPVNPTYKEASQ